MKTIGKYEIRGLLGRGGMGSVYKCLLPVAGKIVALKLLDPTEVMESLVGMEEVERLFLDEVRTLGAINHPAVVDILDFDRDASGRPFYVMEYYCRDLGGMCGETYRTEDPTRIFPVDRACRYMEQVLDGLARMHHAGVIHRDLKPFNIMVTPEDRVKIIDFGLSRLRGERRGATPAEQRKSPKGFKIGTPFYAAPEQERDPDTADARSDLFSAGVMLWRLLTGRLPTEEGVEIEPPSRLNPLLNTEWDEFLFRIVDRDPCRRPESASAMRDELHYLADSFAREMADACTYFEEDSAETCPRFPLRSEGVKVLPNRARRVFPVDGLWRPACVSPGPFEDRGDGTVLDRGAGLVWEQGGSAYPVDMDEAREYVEELNGDGFGGRTNWRLPTVDELLSIIIPGPGIEGYCIKRVFDGSRTRLWSSDRKSFVAGWYADISLGFTAARDFTCRFHVRCVSEL